MAHPAGEAGDAPFDDLDSAAAAIAAMDGDDEPRDDEESDALDEPDLDEDGADDADDQDEGDDEPDEPAIDAPSSLNADEKARFAQLPTEAQRLIAEVETRRNGQVQQATTKAAEAQRAAEATAAQANAKAKAEYAQRLKAIGDAIAPQRPDPRMAQTDPATFIALNAQYEADIAQHNDFMQRAAALGEEADSEIDQTEVAERDRFLLTIPEVANEDTREGFFSKASSAAQRIGLDQNALKKANGQEWKALRMIADFAEKADKYDAAMSKQMQRVRNGRKVTATKPGAARQGGKERAFTEAKQKARSTGSVDDAARLIALLG